MIVRRPREVVDQFALLVHDSNMVFLLVQIDPYHILT